MDKTNKSESRLPDLHPPPKQSTVEKLGKFAGVPVSSRSVLSGPQEAKTKRVSKQITSENQQTLQKQTESKLGSVIKVATYWRENFKKHQHALERPYLMC